MIVIDSSAVIAILLNEPGYERCVDIIDSAPASSMSAATLAETFVVATRKGIFAEAVEFVESMRSAIVPLTEHGAHAVAEAYSRWGKGVHSAGLNFGDCFAYVLAKDLNCPLLFVGNDFGRTDITAAVPIALA